METIERVQQQKETADKSNPVSDAETPGKMQQKQKKKPKQHKKIQKHQKTIGKYPATENTNKIIASKTASTKQISAGKELD